MCERGAMPLSASAAAIQLLLWSSWRQLCLPSWSISAAASGLVRA